MSVHTTTTEATPRPSTAPLSVPHGSFRDRIIEKGPR